MSDEAGPMIKEARQAKGWSQQRLAEEAGVTQSTIDRIENGGAKRSRYLPETYRALDLRADLVLPPLQLKSGFRPPPDIFGERDLPVYAAAEGGPGEMVINTDPIEIVPRPWYMKEVKDGFAILIVGESMIPAYEPGDMAIVNPRLPPMRNKHAVFVTGEHGGRNGGEFKATIKRLIKWDTRQWQVEQYNEPKGFTLERREWPEALRVVGKYEG